MRIVGLWGCGAVAPGGGGVTPRVLGRGRGGGEGWHKASVSDCLSLAAPLGLSPPLILTLCGPKRVLVVSTEPPGGSLWVGGECMCARTPTAPQGPF